MRGCGEEGALKLGKVCEGGCEVGERGGEGFGGGIEG